MPDDQPFDPLEKIKQGELPDDPGGYIGRKPELGSHVIEGGVQPGDERIGGTATQSNGVGAQDHRVQREETPAGHREGANATDDEVRGVSDGS
jgi:hypothetical protein